MSVPGPLDEASFAIRAGRPSDAPALARLLGEMDYPTDASHMLDRLSGMDTLRDLVLVATIGDEPVGMAALHVIPQLHRDAPLARISSVAVARSLRGRGIGERLMHAVEAEAVARGCDRVELVSRASREGAHRFYERLGYEETSERARRFVRSLEPKQAHGATN